MMPFFSLLLSLLLFTFQPPFIIQPPSSDLSLTPPGPYIPRPIGRDTGASLARPPDIRLVGALCLNPLFGPPGGRDTILLASWVLPGPVATNEAAQCDVCVEDGFRIIEALELAGWQIQCVRTESGAVGDDMHTIVMYIGQVMKDLLKLPRPPSPPVVKLETRVDAEYGLPSTHAMAATAISFTLLLSAPSRVHFCFQIGLLIAATTSSLVSLSRLYTGMHSVLDVVCGVLITAVLILLTYPYWESFDSFQLTSPMSPIIALSLLFFLSYMYPELDYYSTTRGDTTTILGVCAGCSVGYWVNAQLGHTFEPQGSLPVPLPTLTALSVARSAGRSLVGVATLVGTRQIVKKLSLDLLYSWYNVLKTDRNARRRKEIEVPSKFVTYTAVGLVNSILVNRFFVLLGLL
ncbi:hypothetical protein CRENBAI_009679 [Crenichthys baileyi]|uniref:Phosphatidic acid phosphatase type 2/haloperoxidase domain-containing protein n=1 Tax=Crenichthys baileyi TaxID=28760 RepID=A0AAV9R7P8_9TELE